MAHAILDLQNGKADLTVAQLDRAEKLGFPEVEWLKTVRTLAQVRLAGEAASLDKIEQLGQPSYVSGSPLRLLYLALIYCDASDLLENKHPSSSELGKRRALDLLKQFLVKGALLPPPQRNAWPPELQKEPTLRPFEPVISSTTYAFLSARAYAEAANRGRIMGPVTREQDQQMRECERRAAIRN